MKFKLAFLPLLSLLVIPAFSHAADAVADKTAVVDIQKIMKDSLAAKDLQKQIEQKKNSFQEEITKQEETLQKEDKALAEQNGVLSSEAFEKKRQAFKSKVEEVQRKVQTRRAQLEGGYANAINEIQESVLKIVESIAKEKGYTLVVPSSQILYAAASMNISDEVLKRLDKDLPKINLVIPDKVEDKKEEKKKKK